MLEEPTLICTTCRESKPLTAFGRSRKNKSRGDGRQYKCQNCATQYKRDLIAGDPDRHRKLHRWAKLKQSYGVTPDKYEEMYRAQGGKCAICASTCDRHKHLSVDHCHTTGKVRGLLCQKCNVALGQLQDDPQLLRAAADYLDERR